MTTGQTRDLSRSSKLKALVRARLGSGEHGGAMELVKAGSPFLRTQGERDKRERNSREASRRDARQA